MPLQVTADGPGTQAYVKWGNGTLESTGTTESASANVTGSYSVITNLESYSFNGEATANVGDRQISVVMQSSTSQTLYDNQIAGGSSTITGTLWVAGLSTTGAIKYVVQLSVLSIGFPASHDWSFSLTQDGTDANFSVMFESGTPGDAFYSQLLQATNSVEFGKPFTLVMSVNSEMNLQAGDPFRYRSVLVQLIDATAETQSGQPLEGQYSLISRDGNLAPRSSTMSLHLQDQGVLASWHSITERFYQAQCALQINDGTWTDLGFLQAGTGTNNSAICTSPAPSTIMRVIEQF